MWNHRVQPKPEATVIHSALTYIVKTWIDISYENIWQSVNNGQPMKGTNERMNEWRERGNITPSPDGIVTCCPALFSSRDYPNTKRLEKIHFSNLDQRKSCFLLLFLNLFCFPNNDTKISTISDLVVWHEILSMGRSLRERVGKNKKNKKGVWESAIVTMNFFMRFVNARLCRHRRSLSRFSGASLFSQVWVYLIEFLEC